MDKNEIELSRLFVERIKKQRSYFQYADESQNLLENQKEDDLLFLQEAFINWIKKLLKEDPRFDEINLLLKSVWRLQGYCGNLETICKASVVEIINLRDKIDNLESRNKILEIDKIQITNKFQTEIKKLEQEIEFTTKNG